MRRGPAPRIAPPPGAAASRPGPSPRGVAQRSSPTRAPEGRRQGRRTACDSGPCKIPCTPGTLSLHIALFSVRTPVPSAPPPTVEHMFASVFPQLPARLRRALALVKAFAFLEDPPCAPLAPRPVAPARHGDRRAPAGLRRRSPPRSRRCPRARVPASAIERCSTAAHRRRPQRPAGRARAALRHADDVGQARRHAAPRSKTAAPQCPAGSCTASSGARDARGPRRDRRARPRFRSRRTRTATPPSTRPRRRARPVPPAQRRRPSRRATAARQRPARPRARAAGGPACAGPIRQLSRKTARPESRSGRPPSLAALAAGVSAVASAHRTFVDTPRRPTRRGPALAPVRRPPGDASSGAQQPRRPASARRRPDAATIAPQRPTPADRAQTAPRRPIARHGATRARSRATAHARGTRAGYAPPGARGRTTTNGPPEGGPLC